MTNILISFLGRVRKGENGYRTTCYRFPDGAQAAETAYIGWTLRLRLLPDRMVVLGTEGSMWDYLVESVNLGAAGEDERLELQDATENKTVQQSLLDRITPMLEKALQCKLSLVIIPYGKIQSEQIELLQTIAAYVPIGTSVSIDITHGFRHLPMIAMMSALHLRVTRQARIKSIYYGSLDPDTGDAPVYDLGGLLQIADWVGALHTFDKDGDYSVLANLLEKDGLTDEQTNHLRQAAFFERTSNAGDARRELLSFENTLSAELPGIGNLFTDQFRERTRWHKRGDLFTWQRDLAKQYLSREDYIHTAIFAYEAFVTRLIDRDKAEREWDYEDRKRVLKAYAKGERGFQHMKKDYIRLKNIRNTLAHGNRSENSKIRAIVSTKDKLQTELKKLIKTLLG